MKTARIRHSKRLFAFFFVAFVLACSANESDAQIFRRFRMQSWGPSNYQAAPVDSEVVSGPAVSSVQPTARLPKWPFHTGYDPRIHRDADEWARYPKYYGGFHSSHFSNVGLPTGDIGFRGNGLYWTPW